MRIFTAILTLSMGIFLTACTVTDGEFVAQNLSEPAGSGLAATPVLVELFTSEGCSSCPPADRVLATIAKDQGVARARVITLGFHVDYWNYLGWRDRFSSAEFSKRQQAYAEQFRLDSSYTPQMVVDGTSQFVGANRPQAIEAISKNAAAPKPAVDLRIAENRLNVNVAGLSDHTDSTVYLAVAENNLATKVGGGENSGSTLQHASVVRDLTVIGNVQKGTKEFRVVRPITTNREWKTENVKLVVFVQENSTLKVLAVNEIGLR